MTGACSTPGAPTTAAESPAAPSTGPVTALVSPADPLEVTLPGVGLISAPVGTFDTAGSLTATVATTSPPEVVGVTLAGPGVDVTFTGTQPTGPLQLTLTEVGPPPSPEDIPVTLHQRHDGTWETLPAELGTNGDIVLSTGDFSPHLPGWLNPLNWLRSATDSAVDAMLSRTDAPPCAGGGPGFARLEPATTLVHSCLTSNTDPATGRVRAEVQLTPNRRFHMWVSAPTGLDYTWLEDQPTALRVVLGRLLGFDAGTTALVDSGTLFTAGAAQPGLDRTATFTAYIDGRSAALSFGAQLLGLRDVSPAQALPALTFLIAQCSDELPADVGDADGAADFAGCLVQAALEGLRDPGKAFATAVDLFGDAAYARESEAGLKAVSKGLALLGKVLKVVGLVGTVRDIWAQIPDAYSQMGSDRPGDVHLQLTGRGPAADLTVGLDGFGPVPWGTSLTEAEEALGARFALDIDLGGGCQQASLPQWPGLTFGIQDGTLAVVAFGTGEVAPITDTGLRTGDPVTAIADAYAAVRVDADPSDAFTTRYTAVRGDREAQLLSSDQVTIDQMQFGLSSSVGEAPCV
jgi:hypothetical protein